MDWLAILLRCGVRAATAQVWAPTFTKVIPHPGVFSAGVMELDDFMGQVLHESNKLERLVEDLRYSATRLTEVWPSRFPTVAVAAPFAHNPEALANHTYGGRLGNVRPGDGWRFRGRGLVQVTGRANYRMLAAKTGLPLEDQPELLEGREMALRASLIWWERSVPDAFMGDIERVTKAVNGGRHGLADRQALTVAAGKAIK